MNDPFISYTAWEEMRKHNLEVRKIDAPAQPRDLRDKKSISNLERAALDFIRDKCRELRFESAGSGETALIYNMARDTDRLCLENAIHRFLQSGTAQDAFDIYFCYLEMFLGEYSSSHKMVELLAEFEINASSLLMKHRDHYSHSVYVFILGMAIYRSSPAFRRSYQSFYGLEDELRAAHHFLRYWGLTALFHDIGYPFELPFEQVRSYFNKSSGVPFISYRGVDEYIAIDRETLLRLSELLGSPLTVGTVNEVLARRVAQLLGEAYGISEERFRVEVLDNKAERPDLFGFYMDHAYFSAVLLFKRLTEVKEARAETLTLEDIDALTAILLHNSIFKFALRVGDYKNKPLEADKHPLAYLLMLCDELQCWDRTAYGQNSRRELHPMWCDLEFDGDDIFAHYQYDRQLEEKKDRAQGTYRKMQGDRPQFVSDIEEIVAVNRPGTVRLGISCAFAKNSRDTRTYLSRSSFLHLYQFAVALNGRYNHNTLDLDGLGDQLEKEFDSLSLEYKLSNILQAKAFSRYLDAIGCFYTDRPVANEKLERFTDSQMDLIGPMEHDRWLEEKRSMGWRYGTDFKRDPQPKKAREETRTHNLMIDDYNDLSKEEQDKDTEPMNCMLKLIEEFDGLRIYRV